MAFLEGNRMLAPHIGARARPLRHITHQICLCMHVCAPCMQLPCGTYAAQAIARCAQCARCCKLSARSGVAIQPLDPASLSAYPRSWPSLLLACLPARPRAGITHFDAKLVFAWSQISVVDELKRRRRAVSLMLFDFIEACARLADLLSPPPKDEVRLLGPFGRGGARRGGHCGVYLHVHTRIQDDAHTGLACGQAGKCLLECHRLADGSPPTPPTHALP